MSDRAVRLKTRDLFFRAKLDALVRAAGFDPVRDGPVVLAVIELGSEDDVRVVEELVRAGTSVIAFTSHTKVELLRAARAAGAEAVPNSELEAATARRLAAIGGAP